MSPVLRFVLTDFQAFPTTTGNSTRHARDMELLPRRALLPVASRRTYSPIWGHETSEGCDDGPQKANIIRWQAQKEIQDRDPKDGPAHDKKRTQACANVG